MQTETSSPHFPLIPIRWSPLLRHPLAAGACLELTAWCRILLPRWVAGPPLTPPRLCNGLKQTNGSSDIEALTLKVSICGSAAAHLHPSEGCLLKRKGWNIIWDKHSDPPFRSKDKQKAGCCSLWTHAGTQFTTPASAVAPCPAD